MDSSREKDRWNQNTKRQNEKPCIFFPPVTEWDGCVYSALVARMRALQCRYITSHYNFIAHTLPSAILRCMHTYTCCDIKVLGIIRGILIHWSISSVGI